MGSVGSSEGASVVYTPSAVCGFHCDFCGRGREKWQGEISKIRDIEPTDIAKVAKDLTAKGMKIERVKFAGISGDILLPGSNLKNILSAAIESLTENKRTFDENGEPRIHVVSNMASVGEINLQALAEYREYILAELSCDLGHP